MKVTDNQTSKQFGKQKKWNSSNFGWRCDQSFSTSALLIFWVFVVEGCPVPCRMFSSIPHLYPRDASNKPCHSCKKQKWMSPDIGKCPLGGKITPSWKILLAKVTVKNKQTKTEHEFFVPKGSCYYVIHMWMVNKPDFLTM